MELTDPSMHGDSKIGQLEEANQQLQESLKACHDLVAQYRSRLAANEIDPLLLGENETDSHAARS